jgi:pilus assembly protein Flp/PilA
MKRLFERLIRDDEGQDLIEYGLLIGVITIGAITAIVAIGGRVQQYFTNLQGALPAGGGGGGGGGGG